MLLSFARATALVTLWQNVHSINPKPALEVPWKHRTRGLYDPPTGEPNFNDGCEHGPKSRACWDGTHSIATDMDLQWPNTGKTVKVGRLECRHWYII